MQNTQPQPIKAKKTTVQLGKNITLDCYMLPKGDYTLAHNSATAPIGKRIYNLTQFLEGNSFEAALCKRFKLEQVSDITVENSIAHIKPIPLFIASSYWRYWAYQGNEKAKALVVALMNGHLLTLFDDAFGIDRTAEDRQMFLSLMLSPEGINRLLEIDRQVEQAITNHAPKRVSQQIIQSLYLKYSRDILQNPLLTYDNLIAELETPKNERYLYAIKDLDEEIALKALDDNRELISIQKLITASPFVYNFRKLSKWDDPDKLQCYLYLAQRINAALPRSKWYRQNEKLLFRSQFGTQDNGYNNN